MKIAKVWNNRYAWDVRVEKISRSLSEDGHDVHLICNGGISETAAHDIPRLSIHSIPGATGRFYSGVISAPLFFNPFWCIMLWRVVAREGIDLILIRDLPLAPVGILVAKLAGIPCIFDMAENYPAMWRELTDRTGMKRLANFFLRNPSVAAAVESWSVRNASHTIVVVEESRERLVRSGADANSITIVGNTPMIPAVQPGTGANEPAPDHDLTGRFVLTYTGFVDNCRGLETVIRAMPALRSAIPEIALVVAGGGDSALLERLELLGKELGVDSQLHFTGWLPHNEIPSHVRRGDICIVPHDSTEMVNSTIPNKLFDYMYAEKPVIVSDARPLKRIVDQFECGAVFHSQDPDSFVDAVVSLRDAATREALGRNGKAAIVSACNWLFDSARLADVIKRFTPGQSHSKSLSQRSDESVCR